MNKYFETKTSQIQAEVKEILSNVDHDGLRGLHGENVLAGYLKEVLPKKYKVDTGLVYGLSTEEKIIKSKQIDIIIHDEIENPPLQIFKGFKIFPSESVYAVISVKLNLTTASLLKDDTNAFENIQSVKNIPKTAILPGTSGAGKPSDTLGVVFSFNNETSLETLAKNSHEIKKKNTPEIICSLDSGSIILQPQKINLTIDSQYIYQGIPILRKQVLMMFTSLLISLLNQQTLIPLDLFKYAYAQWENANN